jgi:uncharacterized lipoprotein YbaY
MAAHLIGVLMSAASFSVIVSGATSSVNALGPPQSRQIGTLTIKGQLAYRQRIALPPDT